MLLTAICEDGFKVTSIENVALRPSLSTQAITPNAEAYQALLDSLASRHPKTLSTGANYLLVLTTSGLGIEEIICCASTPTQLTTDANTLNALCHDFSNDSYSILKVVLRR